jgi:cobalamin biosynthetic protein CobC
MSRDGASGAVTEHGGRLAAARLLFPGAPEPFLDLSTGINPVPYHLPRFPADAFTRLPEPEALWELQAIAAAAYGAASPEMVAAAPGTQILISLLPHLVPDDTARDNATRGRDVAVLGPTYAEHAMAWRAAGARVTAARGLEELAGHEVAVLCNPNNPDGRRHGRAELAELAGRVRLLVVDESFADFDGPERGAAPLLPRPGLMVLRSFGKSYGLAGLRLGFALAEPALADRLRAAMGPWAVSGPALAVGIPALRDRNWLMEAARRCAVDALRLDMLLAQAGFRILGGTSLFRLASHDAAADWFARLGRAGILVRRFRDPADWLRFGLPGDEAGWARLEAVLRPSGPPQ